MFNSYRAVFFALGLILLSGHVQAQEPVNPTFQEQPSPESNVEESNAASEDNSSAETAPAIDPTPALQGIERAIRDLIAEEDQIEQERKVDRENRDLNAQEDMAKWAKWMFYASALTVGVTFIGLLLIWRTLRFTKLTLDEAKRTNAAAWATVDITESATEKQLRAYVTVKKISFSAGSHGTERKMIWPAKHASITVENGGASPALDVVMYAQCRICDYPIRRRDTVFPDAPKNPSRTVLGPRSITTDNIAFPDLNDIRTDIGTGVKALVITGIIRYKDIYKKNRTTKFAFHADLLAIRSPAETVMAACFHSNQAN